LAFFQGGGGSDATPVQTPFSDKIQINQTILRLELHRTGLFRCRSSALGSNPCGCGALCVYLCE